jgi:ribonuclease HII
MKHPGLRYEKAVWKKGYRFVAGIDEVGRGAVAGPVVAGCVVFKRNFRLIKGRNSDVIPKIDDSKKLTSGKREIADAWIRQNAVTWGIGKVTASEIDKSGIVKATNKAIREAVKNANNRQHIRIQYLLIDAFYIPYIRGIRMPLKRYRKRLKGKNIGNSQQTAIIKGDQKCFSIACASIIAKVYRDRLMITLSKNMEYNKYAWDKNKGYGTPRHIKILKRYGKSSLHRSSFL